MSLAAAEVLDFGLVLELGDPTIVSDEVEKNKSK